MTLDLAEYVCLGMWNCKQKWTDRTENLVSGKSGTIARSIKNMDENDKHLHTTVNGMTKNCIRIDSASIPIGPLNGSVSLV